MNFSASNILRIIHAVSKSRTLVSIHLSGNVIDEPKTRQEIRRILRPSRRIKGLDQNIDSPDSNDSNNEDKMRDTELVDKNQ